MDIATIIGIIGGFTLIIGSILLGSPINAFINIPGLMIVVGGTIMATLIMQKMSVVLSAMNVAKNAFFYKMESPEGVINRISAPFLLKLGSSLTPVISSMSSTKNSIISLYAWG